MADLPFALRVPTDRVLPNDGSVLNVGRDHNAVSVLLDPEMSLRGETRYDYDYNGGLLPTIALREWNEQVFLHELLHVATAQCQPLLTTTYPPHGHDVISRIEVVLWETGWRWHPELAGRPTTDDATACENYDGDDGDCWSHGLSERTRCEVCTGEGAGS